MLEVVFSESARGSMRCAQHCGGGPDEFSAFGFFSNGLQPDQEKEMREKALREWKKRQRNAVSLGGNPTDVFGLSFTLSIGDIAAPLESGPRRDLIFRMATENWPNAEEMRASMEQDWQRSLTDLEALKRRAKAGEPVRIWYDFSPDGMCGLYFTAAQLKEARGRVSVVCLPLWKDRGDAIVQHTSWAEMAPEEIGSFLSLEREISPLARNALARGWKELQSENAPLRAVVNGRLRSVDEHFYDYFIRAAVPEGDFAVGLLIGAVLGRYQLRTCDGLIARSIRAMIDDGILRIVKKSDHPYETILRASATSV